MGREIKRVPLDFDAPLGKVWAGYIMPSDLHGNRCEACDGSGYSPQARRLQDIWYGNAPFKPEDNGSTPLTTDTPVIRALAERNVTRSPEFYGSGEQAIRREARRLADLWNGQWSHHLNEHDVAALVEAERLYDLTHAWTRENRWQSRVLQVVPTPEQVNEWSIRTFGHDAINAWVVVKARCEREGVPNTCGACDGAGKVWRDADHKAAHEAWKSSEPPSGDGWQLWETVSEGSPISPVFATSDELATWMSDPAKGRDWVSGDVAARFIAEGWAPSFVGSAETGVVSGVEFVGTTEAVNG